MKYSIAHFGITVSNLEKSTEFYKNNFEFKEIRRINKPDLELKLTLLQLGNSYLELIQPYCQTIKIDLRKNPSLKERLQKSTSHIALNINDVNLAYKKLKENNVETTDFNEKFFFCKDPDGFLIEVRQK